MNRSLRSTIVAASIALVLVVMPRPAHAQYAVTVVGGIGTIQETISAIADPVSAASTLGSRIKEYVLDPLAHALAQAVLKSITASVVDSINGKNGGAQFVKNLSANLQGVGDKAGLSFIAQFGSSINSPFSAAISNALHSSYLQSTSLAGFFAANQCTLTKSSPNINSFLTGNFKQGGWSAWFSLTTQNQNNPFTLFQVARNQLANSVTSVQSNQRQTISQNNGFLSWCSAADVTTDAEVPATPDVEPPDLTVQPDGSYVGACPAGTTDQDGACIGKSTCPAGYTLSGNNCTPPAAPKSGAGADCLNKDGIEGSVQTPGSVIHDSLTKALGSGVDSLVSVHDFDQMVDTILSALVTKVVSTGLSALSGGGSSSSGNGSFTDQLNNPNSGSDPNAPSIAAQATSLAQSALANITKYVSSWQTIKSAADTASSTVQQLADKCPDFANDAQTILTSKIQPVLNQAQTAFATASSTQALALRVQQDASALTGGAAGAGGAITVDTQTLAAAPPSIADIGTAQAAAAAGGGATSSPNGSLNVAGGSLVDQLNLINQNAKALTPFCGVFQI